MAGKPEAVLAAAVGVIVAVAGTAAVVAVRRDGAGPDAGTPEAVVAAYLRALASGDLPAALDQLEPSTPCGLDDLARAYVPTSLRAVLAGTTGDDEAVVVTVEITENPDESLMGSGGWSHDERIVLHRVDDAWRITGEPWPVYGCGGGGKG